MAQNLSVTLTVSLLALVAGGLPTHRQEKVKPAEPRAIAKEAYIYGSPLLDQYRIMYASSINKTHPEYKWPFNTIMNVVRVYCPLLPHRLTL